MPSKVDAQLRFKLDENTPRTLKAILESTGEHQVDSVYHEQLTGISDHRLIALCRKEKRVLLPLATDFLNPLLHPPQKIFGIIVLRPHSQGKQAVTELFSYFLTKDDLTKALGKVIIVEPYAIRVRK